MKMKNGALFGLAVLYSVWAWQPVVVCGANAPALPTEFQYTLECRALQTNSAKWGFVRPTECTNRNVYFKVVDYSETLSSSQSYYKFDIFNYNYDRISKSSEGYELSAASRIVQTNASVPGHFTQFTGQQTYWSTNYDFLESYYTNASYSTQQASTVSSPIWPYTGYDFTNPNSHEVSPAGWVMVYHTGYPFRTYETNWVSYSEDSNGVYTNSGFRTEWDFNDIYVDFCKINTNYTDSGSGAYYYYTYTNLSVPNFFEEHYTLGSLYAYSQADPLISETNRQDRSHYRSFTFSEEYSTPELVSKLYKIMDEVNGDWITSGNESPKAGVEIGDNESSAVGQAVEARLKVFAQTNELWEIPYLRWRIGYTNGVPVWTNRSEELVEGIGTGDWVYTNIAVATPYWTYTNGDCIYYAKAEEWIEVGCGSTTACGSGNCGNSPGNAIASLRGGSPFLSITMGSSAYGEGSASLVTAGSRPSQNLVQPQGLQVFGDYSGGYVYRDGGGAISQVVMPKCVANVELLSSSSYRIKCYENSGSFGAYGPYNMSGYTEFSTITIASNSTADLAVTQVKDGATTVAEFNWDESSKEWELAQGGGMRRESTSWDEANLKRTERIKNAGSNVLYEELEWYMKLPTGGNVLTQRVVGGVLTNRWVYYTNSSTDGAAYGKLKYAIEPSGFWTYYEYTTNGLVQKEVLQFGNADPAAATNAPNSCRVVDYDYTPIDGAKSECRIEKLLGQEIGRSYTMDYGGTVLSVQCQTPGADWNAASNLITVTTYGTDGEVWRIVNPDGTIQLSTTVDMGGNRIATTLSGVPGNSSMTNVVSGSSNVTSTAQSGELQSRNQYDIESGVELANETFDYDDLGRRQATSSFGVQSEWVNYDCCGIESIQDRSGAMTYFYYDALKRQTASKQGGIITTNILDAAGNVLATVRIGTNGSAITLSQSGYDTAGQVIATTNALGGPTSYAETKNGSGETVKTTTNPDGGTRIETFYQDGSLKSVTGTAASQVRYEYGVESEGGIQRVYTKEIKLNTTGTDTTEWTKSYTDMLGRSYKTEFAKASTPHPYTLSSYNNAGQLASQVDPDGVVTLYGYNAKGELEYTCLDSNRNYTMDFSGADRITRTINVVTNSLEMFSLLAARGSLTYQWSESGPVLAGERWTSVNGLYSASIAFGQTNQSQISYLGGGVREVSATAPDGTYTVNHFEGGRLTSTTTSGSSSSGLTLRQVNYGYDAHGRQSEVAVLQPDNSSYATTSFGYNAADQVTTNTSPVPASGQSAQTTLSFYDTSLRLGRVVQPDSTSVTNEYYATGSLKKTYGSRTYPVEYTYDYAGRMKTMKTWQNFSAGSGTATTTWNYDAYLGWLENKRYNDNTGPNYTYTAAGRLLTRSWARGVTTTYGYNDAGDLTSVDYSDSTPDVTYGYDRRGRQKTVNVGGSLNTTRVYSDAGLLLGEAYASGPLSGLRITNQFDELLRRTNFVLFNGSTALNSNAYAYGVASRLESVSSGLHSASYSYLANSPLVEQIAYTNNGIERMVTLRGYDALNRLTNMVSHSNGVPYTSFAYGYNAANQRDAVTNADNSRWSYQYDNLGQITSGRKYWEDGTAVEGEQFDYTYDDIGNRKTAVRDGRSASYTPNLLNQYTSRTVPGFVNILGEATNASTVTVNNTPSTRHSNYFRVELAVTNSSPLWLGLTNLAVLNNGVNPDIIATNTGNLFVPQTPEAFAYDADGNLTNDGRWQFTWDGENRLVKMESKSGAPTASKLKLEFAYDVQGKRIEKIVSTNNGSTYVAQSTNRFAYDGWNLVAVVNPNATVAQSFHWGLDLSGTMQGAGGVGALLWARFDADPQFAAFDGNGNVAALVNGSTGALNAQYEYGPFGELVRATGSLATANPFRFSTKYQDNESDLLYYGYRYYNASTGRWVSRDSIEEIGGLNLYGAFLNVPTSYIDLNGNAAFLSMPLLAYQCTCKCLVAYYLGRGYESKLRAMLVQSINWNISEWNPELSKGKRRVFDDLMLLGKKGGDLGQAILARTICGGLGVDINNDPDSKDNRDASTSGGRVRLNVAFPHYQYLSGIYEDLLGVYAESGAITLGHELGHAYIGLDDPFNMYVVDNPIRRALGRPERQRYNPLFNDHPRKRGDGFGIVWTSNALFEDGTVVSEGVWYAQYVESQKARNEFVKEWTCK